MHARARAQRARSRVWVRGLPRTGAAAAHQVRSTPAMASYNFCYVRHVARCTPHTARRMQRHIGKSGITCGLRLRLAGEQHADAAQRRRGWPFCRVQDGTPCMSCVPPAATQCTAWFCCNGARYVATAAFKMGASRGYYKGIQGVGMPAAARPASDGRVARLFAVACCALCAACAAGCMSLVVYRRLHVSG